MEILEYGCKGKNILILIHGFESPYQVWNEYIEHYKNEYHIIVPIMPGHNVQENKAFLSFEQCATELEDFCLEHCGNQIYAVYGMSMGGVLASCIWKNKRLQIKKLILESSPLLPWRDAMISMMTKQYLSMTHKAQRRDKKTVQQATRSIVTTDKLDAFLEMLDHISDETITRYLIEVGKFRLPADINTPNTKIIYYYGGKLNELPFRKVARYIKKYYKNAVTICLKGKGHCEDALMNPENWLRELNRTLAQ